MKTWYIVSDIQWDTEQNGEIPSAETLGLPSTGYCLADEEDEVIDVISDRYGYCVVSASIEAVPDRRFESMEASNDDE